jgi:hypothetical protein
VIDVGLQESLNNALERDAWLDQGKREGNERAKGSILLMNQIYYNFIRPHQGLKGATPAEAVGIGVGGENKWVGLIMKSNQIIKK